MEANEIQMARREKRTQCRRDDLGMQGLFDMCGGCSRQVQLIAVARGIRSVQADGCI